MFNFAIILNEDIAFYQALVDLSHNNKNEAKLARFTIGGC